MKIRLLLLGACLFILMIGESEASKSKILKKQLNKRTTVSSLTRSSKKTFMPQPTEIPPFHKEGRKRYSRSAWIDTLHRIAPGNDWRKVEESNRERMSVLRSIRAQEKVESNLSGSKLQTFANGRLTGYWWERGSADQSGSAAYVEYDVKSDTIISRSASGNIWKATLEGNNWKLIDDAERLQYRLRITVNSKDRLIRWSGTIPQYSDDWGKKWQNAAELSGLKESREKYSWGNIERVMRAKDVLYMVSREWNGDPWGAKWTLYRSSDFGKTYTQVFTTMKDFTLWTNGEFSSNAYFTTEGLLKKIASTGAITDLSTLPTTNSQISGGFDDGKSLFLYAYADGNLYKSNNGAKAWTLQGKTADGNITFVSQSDHNLITCGFVDCYKSTDAGKTWNVINRWNEYYGQPDKRLHADIMHINSFFDKGGKEVILICCHGGLYVSYDKLQTVQNLSLKNHNISQYYSTITSFYEPDIIYAGSQDQGYQRSEIDTTTNALNFQQVISGDYGHFVSSDSARTFWMTYPGFLAYLPEPRKGGLSSWWDYTSKGQLWMAPLMADPDNPAAVFMCGGAPENEKGGRLYQIKSVNGKAVVTVLPFDFGSQLTAANYSPKNKKVRFVLTSNSDFYATVDGGKTWSPKSSKALPGGHYFYGNCILPSPLDERRVYVSGSGYSGPGVFRSTDYGATWTALSEDAPSTLFYRIVCTPDEKFIFAATEAGPYVYSTEEKKWYDMYGLQPGGAPDQTYWSVEYVEPINVVRFCTYGRGVWDFEISNFNPGVTLKVQGKMSDFCEDQPIPFLALPINGGKKPVYVWKVNGKEIAKTANKQYVAQGLKSGDKVTCDVLSSTNGKTAVSNTVSLQLKPSVTISTVPEATIAQNGVPTSIKANVSGVLKAPKIRWIVNDDTVNTKDYTFDGKNLQHGDLIQCEYYSENECTNPAISKFTIGIARFVHSIASVNVPIRFTDRTPFATKRMWSFGDGTSSSLVNPYKIYSKPGEYTVTLTVEPGNTYYTKKIVVGSVTAIPYTNNFEANDGGFQTVSIVGDGSDKWEWGSNVSGKKFMNGASGVIEGKSSWITNIGKGQGNRGNVYALETPPFSFVGAEGDYRLGFSFRQMTSEGAGLNVQASTDKGKTWKILGQKDDKQGQNWYNFDNLWSLEGAGFNYFNMDVQKSSISVNQFIGKDDVRFRFVNATTNEDEDGVMLDEVYISGKETKAESPVETIITSSPETISSKQKVDFYSAEGKIMATIENLSENAWGNVTVSIVKSGNSGFTLTESKKMLADKVFYVNGDTNTVKGSAKVTLYYTKEEVGGWEKVAGETKDRLGIVYAFSDIDANSKPVELSNPGNGEAFKSDYFISGVNQGRIIGGYAVAASIASNIGDSHDGGSVVYPNPVGDMLMISMEGIESIELIDLEGKLVLHSSPLGGRIPVGDVPAGVYLVHLHRDGKIIYKGRIVKK